MDMAVAKHLIMAVLPAMVMAIHATAAMVAQIQVAAAAPQVVIMALVALVLL
jgi:hypothetical protein